MNEFELLIGIAGLAFSTAILVSLLMLPILAIWAPDQFKEVMKLITSVVIALGLLGLCVFVTPVLGFFAWLVVMMIWVRSAIHLRAAQKRSLFGALALAVDKQMPLAPMAMAFADEQYGTFGGRARALAHRLNAGMPLVEAIGQSPGALPREATMAVRVGVESGDLPGALEATSLGDGFDRTMLRSVMSRLFYIFPVMVIFLLFMNIKIAPSFVKIFSDFGTALPPITHAVIGSLSSPWMVFILTVLSLLTFAVPFWAWCEWRGWIRPTLPGLRRIIRWVDMGAVLRVLALATRRDCPLPRMLGALAASHPKPAMRRRLRTVVADIKDGCSWQKSLQLEGLIGQADAAVLGAAQRSGNLSWALAQMADSYQRKATYRLQALAQVVLPLLMVPIGLLMCLLAAAYFAPLTKLILDLS